MGGQSGEVDARIVRIKVGARPAEQTLQRTINKSRIDQLVARYNPRHRHIEREPQSLAIPRRHTRLRETLGGDCIRSIQSCHRQPVVDGQITERPVNCRRKTCAFKAGGLTKQTGIAQHTLRFETVSAVPCQIERAFTAQIERGGNRRNIAVEHALFQRAGKRERECIPHRARQKRALLQTRAELPQRAIGPGIIGQLKTRDPLAPVVVEAHD